MENYILEKFHREKVLKQEELTEALNVSPQAAANEDSEVSHFISLRNPQLLILLSDLSSSEPNVA